MTLFAEVRQCVWLLKAGYLPRQLAQFGYSDRTVTLALDCARFT